MLKTLFQNRTKDPKLRVPVFYLYWPKCNCLCEVSTIMLRPARMFFFGITSKFKFVSLSPITAPHARKIMTLLLFIGKLNHDKFEFNTTNYASSNTTVLNPI